MVFIGDMLVVSNHTPINLVPIKITWKMCIEEGLAVYFIIIISKEPARLHGNVWCGKFLEGGGGIVKGLGTVGDTVFPRNLATARFNFNSLHPAVRFRGRRDFEGGD